MNDDTLDTISSRQIAEFCGISDRAVALDFAVATASRSYAQEAIREPWSAVEHILRFPFDIKDDSRFQRIEKSLGPKIVVKVYKFYLQSMQANNVAPGYQMPERRLVGLLHKADYTQSEFLEVFILHRRIGTPHG